MPSPTSTGFKGLHVTDNTSSETERTVVTASGELHHIGTKLTPTAAELNNVNYVGYFPAKSTQIIMQDRVATCGASLRLVFSQLSTINSVQVSAYKALLGATLVGSGAPRAFTWSLVSGATIDLFGWKGGAAATADGIAYLLAIGT